MIVAFLSVLIYCFEHAIVNFYAKTCVAILYCWACWLSLVPNLPFCRTPSFAILACQSFSSSIMPRLEYMRCYPVLKAARAGIPIKQSHDFHLCVYVVVARAAFSRMKEFAILPEFVSNCAGSMYWTLNTSRVSCFFRPRIRICRLQSRNQLFLQR